MGPICFSGWVYGIRSKKDAYIHALAKSGHNISTGCLGKNNQVKDAYIHALAKSGYTISTGCLGNNNQVKDDLIQRILSGDLL